MDQLTELINKVRSDDVKSVEAFLSSHDIDLNQEKPSSRVTPLMVACTRGHTNMVKLLINQGAQVNYHATNGWSAFSKAYVGENAEVVKLLIENGAVIEDFKDVSPLYISCKEGDIKMVQALLARGGPSEFSECQVAYVDDHGWNYSFKKCPVNIAVQFGHIELVKWLLEAGMKVPFGSLILAVCKSSNEMFEILLKYGADVNMKGDGGWSVLMLASFSGENEMVKMLLGKGAEVNALNEMKHFALALAAEKGHVEVVQMLLENGADINLQGSGGHTALYKAVYGGRAYSLPKERYISTVEILLDKGAEDLSVAFKFAVEVAPSEVVKLFLRENSSALIEALPLNTWKDLSHGPVEVLRLLLDMGLDVNRRDEDGKPLLMHAYQKEIIKLLLDYGADPNVQDNDGEYALLKKIIFHDVSVIELLLEYGADSKLVADNGQTSLLSWQRNLWMLQLDLAQYPRLSRLLNGSSATPKSSGHDTAKQSSTRSGYKMASDSDGHDTVSPGTVSSGSVERSRGHNMASPGPAKESGGHDMASPAEQSSTSSDHDTEFPGPAQSSTSRDHSTASTGPAEQEPFGGHEQSSTSNVSEAESPNSIEGSVAENGDDGKGEASFIKGVEDAIADGKPISRKHAHSIFVGPPGSGKSSLMDRLLLRMKKAFSGSTGVSESIVVVDIDISSSFHAVTVIDPSTWREVDYDTSLVRQMNAGSVAISHLKSEETPKTTIFESTTIDPSTVPESPIASPLPMSTCNSAVSDHGASITIKPAISTDGEIREMISAAIQNCGGYKEFKKSYSGNFSLYMRDTGGHMAFQEMLSVLIRGPSIFIFVFRMDLDLKKKFTVEYRVGPGESLNCTTASITTEEALLQCLASVYAMDTPASANIKTHKPLVLIIGTHKDKLGQLVDKKIADLNEHLDCLIDSCSCFQDLVVYADRGKREVMFAVDNTSESDEDFKPIRSKIHHLVSNCDEFTVEYPVHCLLFALELQQEKCDVIGFDRCKAIAAKYGIVGEKVSHLLQFLHFRVGIIQYFNEEGLIMIKPQVLFNRVTDLVKRTFSSKYLTAREARDFEKGLPTASLVKSVVTESDITPEKFIQLLTRLRIITPFTLPGEQEERYFMPCVLKHVPESNVEELRTDILPLAIQFECEHCPKGLFSVLVIHLMTAEESSNQISFSLMQDKIFRDQVSFEVHSHADEDEVSVKAFPSHLEICFFPSSCDDRDVTIRDVCNAIRNMVERSLSKSLDYLCYAKEKMKYVMSFKCESCHELHPVRKGNKYKIHCKRYRKTSRIPPLGRFWYGEDVIDVSPLSSVPNNAATSGTGQLQAAASTKLSAHDISVITDHLTCFAHMWKDIGRKLCFTDDELNNIEARPASQNITDYLSNMLSNWRQWAPGDSRGSKGYATLDSLKRALDKAGLAQLAEELDVVINS